MRPNNFRIHRPANVISSLLNCNIVAHTFLYTRFLPAWVLEKNRGDHEMPFVEFAAAYSRWALFADAVGMCPRHASSAHFDNCLRVGHDERIANRGAGLAVAYDQAMRQHIADMSRCEVQQV